MYPPTDMYGRPMRVRAPGEFNPDRAFRVSVELKGLPASLRNVELTDERAQHGTSEPAETADRPPPPRPMSAQEIKERRNKLATPPNRRGLQPPTRSSAEQFRLAQRLAQFYAHYAPDKLQFVDEIANAYAGREEQLQRSLRDTFGDDCSLGRPDIATPPNRMPHSVSERQPLTQNRDMMRNATPPNRRPAPARWAEAVSPAAGRPTLLSSVNSDGARTPSEPSTPSEPPPVHVASRPMSAKEMKERRNKLATPPNRRGDTSWVAITGRDSRLAVPPAYSPAPTDEYALARSLHESTPAARSVRAPGQFHPDVSYARTLSTQGPPPNPHASPSHRRTNSRSPRSVAFELDTPLSAPCAAASQRELGSG